MFPHGGNQMSLAMAAGFGLGVTPWTYALTQCQAILLYLKLSIWPHPLVFDYGTEVVRDPALVIPCALLVVALAAERHALRGSLQDGCSGALDKRPFVRGTLAGRDVLLLQAGIGRERARQAVIAAARAFGAHAVWSLGFAGGLAWKRALLAHEGVIVSRDW